MDPLSSSSRPQASNPMAYTDLSSLQNIKGEADKDVALHKVAKQFESMFVGLLFKGMRQANAVFEEGNMGHSNAEKTYRDMYDQQMSMDISGGRGLGIAAMVYRQLKGNERQAQVAEKLDESNLHRPDKKLPSLAARAIDTTSTHVALTKQTKLDPSSLNTEGATLANQSPLDFAKSLLPIVKRGAEALGLDPMVVIAQAALETGWGKHVIKNAAGQSSNNLFNIKADSRWNGDSVSTSTLEFKQGIAVRETAKFRQYGSIAESVNDYLDFVKSNPRYDDALKVSGDPHAYIEEIHNAGYATDPKYAEKIKAVLEKLNRELVEG